MFDPWVSEKEALHEYGITTISRPNSATYDAIIVAVAHTHFREMGADAIRSLGKVCHVLYDMKYLFPIEASDLRL